MPGQPILELAPWPRGSTKKKKVKQRSLVVFTPEQEKQMPELFIVGIAWKQLIEDDRLVSRRTATYWTPPRWSSRKASASREADMRIDLRFPLPSHTSGYLCRYLALQGHTGSGWSGVTILWPGEIASVICSLYFSEAAGNNVDADLCRKYTLHVVGT